MGIFPASWCTGSVFWESSLIFLCSGNLLFSSSWCNGTLLFFLMNLMGIFSGNFLFFFCNGNLCLLEATGILSFSSFDAMGIFFSSRCNGNLIFSFYFRYTGNILFFLMLRILVSLMQWESYIFLDAIGIFPPSWRNEWESFFHDVNKHRCMVHRKLQLLPTRESRNTQGIRETSIANGFEKRAGSEPA